MAIDKLTVQEFSVFRKETEMEFSPGINVFLGENATGKTHIMKLVYSILSTVHERQKIGTADEAQLSLALKDKLAGVFVPAEGQVGRLPTRRVGRHSAKVALTRMGDQELAFSLSTLGNLRIQRSTFDKVAPAIFVPSREALAMYEGFIGAYDQRELSFDQTYYDLCKFLSAKPLKGARAQDVKELVGPIETILGGGVTLEGGRFYVRRPGDGGGILEAHLLAEGHRKLASIAYLITNGALMKHSVLFWDEPEANLNPKLTLTVVAALRALAQRGVQVFLATHDYLISQELALHDDYGVKPKVRQKFFAFTRDPRTGYVCIDSADQLAELKENAILQEFADHYDREQRLFLGTEASPTTGGQ